MSSREARCTAVSPQLPHGTQRGQRACQWEEGAEIIIDIGRERALRMYNVQLFAVRFPATMWLPWAPSTTFGIMFTLLDTGLCYVLDTLHIPPQSYALHSYDTPVLGHDSDELEAHKGAKKKI